MKIGVLWRKFRNVEFQKKLTPDNIFDDAYGEAYLHYQAIKEAGFEAIMIEWDDDPIKTHKIILDEAIDLIFNASSLKEMIFLETFKIPYVGSGIDLVATDKSVRKLIVDAHNVPTPKFVIAHSPDNIPSIDFDYPLFVKPISGRGSAGIDNENIIYEKGNLPKVVEKITDKIGQAALIEQYIKGREICVGIIGYEDPIVLPLLEIQYDNTLTNTYELKMFGKAIVNCPIELDKEVEENIKNIALAAYRGLNVKDFGRMDFILDENNVPYFLEINTFAGLAMVDEEDKEVHHGYMAYMAKAMNWSRAKFIGEIVKSAIKRYNL